MSKKTKQVNRKASVSLANLFHGEMLGGMDPREWEPLPMGERLTARLQFIANRAQEIASMVYHPNNGWPANVHGNAARLSLRANEALAHIERGDIAAAAWLAIEVGKMLEGITTTLSISKTLDVTTELIIHEPDIQRGQKSVESGTKGSNDRWKQTRQNWSEYQPFIDDLHKRRPQLTYADLRRQAAKAFGVSESTIKKRTQNPKKLGK